MIKQLIILFCGLLIVSCSDNNIAKDTSILQNYLETHPFETGAVIACAGNNSTNSKVQVYYYPESGATNIHYYESDIANEKDNYASYKQVVLIENPFFNDYLRFFEKEFISEKWIIVTFEKENEIKVSNPIRLKQISKATQWFNDVKINVTEAESPIFDWSSVQDDQDAIYFQIVSDASNNLLTGTYTYDTYFQYYNVTNVVLNITTGIPPHLIIGNDYQFTLMGVSEDNWINVLIQRPFTP